MFTRLPRSPKWLGDPTRDQPRVIGVDPALTAISSRYKQQLSADAVPDFRWGLQPAVTAGPISLFPAIQASESRRMGVGDRLGITDNVVAECRVPTLSVRRLSKSL